MITASGPQPGLAAAAPPGAEGAHAALTPGHPVVLSRSALAASQPSAPANKTTKKPFRNAWMTKERPSTWNRLSVQSVLMPVPLSFTPIGFAPGDAQSRAPTAVATDRDILTSICVARR